MNVVRGVLMILGAWTALSFLLILAICLPRARDNAKVRATRRQMRAELEAQLEQDRYDREFDDIARHWKTDA